MKRIFAVFALFVMYSFVSQLNAQYNMVGSTFQTGPNCYTLTPAVNSQAGSLWNETQINLNYPFDITLSVNFGCNDGGADGLSFIFQPSNTLVSAVGTSCGYAGIGTSLGVVFDTYNNGPIPINSADANQSGTTDPVADHVSVHTNGYNLHATNAYVGGAIVLANQIAAPVSLANIEDCAFHLVRITWNPVTKILEVYLDGTQYISVTYDIVNIVFGGNPMVYWGLGASTGSQNNLQTFCLVRFADFIYNNGCSGSATQFTDISVSNTAIASWLWDFGDGNTSTLQNPTHVYNSPGIYNVTLTIYDGSGNVLGTQTHTIEIYEVDVQITNLAPILNPGDSLTLNGTTNIFPPNNFITSAFTNTTDYQVIDGGVASTWTGTGDLDATVSSINVSGLLSGWRIDSIRISANITRAPMESRIYLETPCGNIVGIFKGAYTNTNPSGGLNGRFTNTCFTPYSTINLLSLTTSANPYTDQWASTAGWIWPTIDNCATPNGTWNLIVGDISNTGVPWTQYLEEWSIYFSNPTTPLLTYVWTPGNITNTLNPTVYPNSNGYYILTATDANGCTGADSVLVSMLTLPVTLIDFEATCIHESVLLSWQTASETNNNFFTIEKSDDNQNFSVLATIAASGNSNSVTEYSFLDETQGTAMKYYRLSQTDFDGTTVQLSLKSAFCMNEEDEFSINSISATNNNGTEINVTISSEGLFDIEIFNSIGQMVYQNTAWFGVGEQIISIPFYKSGVYLLNIQSDNIQRSQKFVQ